MPRPNLLKMDELLLRWGGALALVWAFGALLAGLAWLNLSGTDASLPAAALLVTVASATAPAGLLLGGRRLRRREQRAWALARLVRTHVELPASDLLRASDFTPRTLDRAIRDLNNAGAAFLVWDREADVVQDGRLRRSRVHVDKCGSCGAEVSVDVELGDLQTPRCPYCHDPLAAGDIAEEREELIDELRADIPREARSSPASGSFSVPLFALLTLLCWPLGVAYAWWHWRALLPSD